MEKKERGKNKEEKGRVHLHLHPHRKGVPKKEKESLLDLSFPD